jgi:hypothetical protein
MLGPHVIHKKAGGQVLPFSFSSGLPRLASSAHHLRRVLCTLMAASAGAATISFPYLMASASGACRHGTALRICATTGTGEAAMDVVSEAELREKGFMGMGKTKLVCTVGPPVWRPCRRWHTAGWAWRGSTSVTAAASGTAPPCAQCRS